MSYIKERILLGGKLCLELLGNLKQLKYIARFDKIMILVKALKTERPSTIINNFKRFLYKKQKEEEFRNNKSYNATSGYIKYAYFIKNKKQTTPFLLGGWVITNSVISRIEILQDNKVIGLAKYAKLPGKIIPIELQKIKGRYTEYSFSIDEINTKTKIELYVYSNEGELICTEIILPLTVDKEDLSLEQQYQLFLKKEEHRQLKSNRKSILSYQPKISIITPVYNVEPQLLRECIESVLAQSYENWELCLHDDKSTNLSCLEALQKWQNKDERIKISYGQQNLHISGASNEALKLATGEFIGLLDNDDVLTEDALYEVAKVLNKDDSIDFVYSDEDKLDYLGQRVSPHFKPDFNIDFLRSNNYLCHFSVIRKKLIDEIGGFTIGLEGAQDFDLFLRIIEKTQNVYHIPKVLYHWRLSPESTAGNMENKHYAIEAGKKAIKAHLKRTKIEAEVFNGKLVGTYRIKRVIKTDALVSIIIPFKDQVKLLKDCVESIFEKTEYKEFEIILVSNNSTKRATFNYVQDLVKKHSNIKFYEYNIPFSYSKINNWAVEKAGGSYCLLLNNDIKVINKGWLSAMVEHIQRDEVGAVGAKLLYPDNTVQHAGVFIGVNGVADHAHRHFPDSSFGYFGRKETIQNLSACTAACLLVKKTIFQEVGGLEEELAIAYNDIDLCLKIRALNYLIVYTPYAILYHYESKSRGLDNIPEKLIRFNKEVAFFEKKWKHLIEEGDPYYNPNLSFKNGAFNLNL